MDFDLYIYDEDLAEKGRKISFPDGSYVVICRWGNKKFFARYQELVKPYQRDRSNNAFANFQASGDISDLPDDEVPPLMRELIADSILIGWEGMQLKGKTVPYSKENCLMILEKAPVFMQQVIDQSQNDDNFRAAEMEEGLKNSETNSEQSLESDQENDAP